MVLGVVKERSQARTASGFIPRPLLRAKTAGCLSGRKASQLCRPRLRRVEQRAVEKTPNEPRLEDEETGA
jgi:hypothetical protein